MDQRENILSRLVAVCAAVQGVANAVRNRLDVGTLERPTIVILDGTESFVDAPAGPLERHSQLQRMELLPALSIHVRGSDLVDGGNLLSLYRARILAAVLNDAALIGYVGTNGRIRYAGAAVAVPAAEGKEYRIDLSLVFTYVFSLADLSAEGRSDGPQNDGSSRRPAIDGAPREPASNDQAGLAA
jgi:hypothetical protein